MTRYFHEELEQILAEAEELENLPVRADKAGPIGSAGAIPRHDPALTEPAATDPARAASRPADEPSDFGEGEMLNIWLDVPPSPAARTITATRGEPILPRPFEIDESDLAPE